ncbi:MAG: FAD-dependent oxidoreductase [Clostridia bacterium]|nr:FAD-dependent oxidoreductase [Clostridia bacterium]
MKKEFILRMVLVAIIAVLIYQFGLKPMFTNKNTPQKSSTSSSWSNGKLVSDKGKYDVVVLGEMPEGIASAVSAARSGAKTLLICEGMDLGSIFTQSLLIDFEIYKGDENQYINQGIFYELYDKIGEEITPGKYKDAVTKMVKAEEKLEVIYGSRIISPVLKGNVLEGINLSSGGIKKTILGKRFIDATSHGNILIACNVPYFNGSEDINISKNYLPLKLNFLLSGTDPKEFKNLVKTTNISVLYQVVKEYKPSSEDIRIQNFKMIFDETDQSVIVQGIEMSGVDVLDKNILPSAYKKAADEAKKFAKYLSDKFKAFKDTRFVKAANEFYIRESRHYKGEYTLKVNEILENKNFDDKIVLAAGPVDASKVVNNGFRYIIGKPTQYSIPLGCIIPLKTDNILMVGNKASYASLAATSTGTVSVNISLGEAAGIAAVFSLTENISPREMLKSKDISRMRELQKILKKQGVYLDDFSFKNPNLSSWVYPAIKELNSLGLISGGMGNNYGLAMPAKQQDLAILLLNGVLRVSPSKYTLDLDSRIRSYFTEDDLTPNKAGELLTSFYDVRVKAGSAYNKACESGYINDIMQLKLKDKKILTLDDVFYLASYNIKNYAGESIPE